MRTFYIRQKDEYVSPETEVIMIALEAGVAISNDPEEPTEPIGGGDNPDIPWNK